jgi:hypothetical protein
MLRRVRWGKWCKGSYLERSPKGLEEEKILVKVMRALLTCPSSGSKGVSWCVVELSVEVLNTRTRWW